MAQPKVQAGMNSDLPLTRDLDHGLREALHTGEWRQLLPERCGILGLDGPVPMSDQEPTSFQILTVVPIGENR